MCGSIPIAIGFNGNQFPEDLEERWEGSLMDIPGNFSGMADFVVHTVQVS